jgi:hypothetical protein
MQELINQITSRTGVSEEQAQQAISIVFSFVKDKLPEPIASQVGGYLGLESGGAGGLMGQLGNLGGMFGGNNQ